jgi:hypothetical protein
MAHHVGDAALGDDLNECLEGVLAHRATLAVYGEPLVGGVPWTQSEARRSVVDIVGVRDLRSSCAMTTFDPDTLAQVPKVLRRIAREFGGELALKYYVIRGGEIQVGDTVELVPSRECAGLQAR